MILTSLEQRLLDHVAKKAAVGDTAMIQIESLAKELGVDRVACEVAVKQLEISGAVEDLIDVEARYGRMAVAFRPSSTAVQIQRQAEVDAKAAEAQQKAAAAHRPDFVEQIHNRFRTNPVTAWGIVIFAGLMVLMGFIKLLADVVEVFTKMFGGG